MTDQTLPQGQPDADAKPGLVRRIVMFPLSLLLIEFFLVALSAIIASNVMHRLSYGAKDSPMHALGGLVVGIAAMATYHACQRWIERRDDVEFGLQGLHANWGWDCWAGSFCSAG